SVNLRAGRAGLRHARFAFRRVAAPDNVAERWPCSASAWWANGERCALAESQDQEVRRRGGEEHGVDAVQDAAVAAEEAAGVLHLHVALEHRLEEVADRRCDGEHGAEDERLRDREEVLLVEADERDEDRRRCAEDESLPRLPRRRGRRHAMPAEDL